MARGGVADRGKNGSETTLTIGTIAGPDLERSIPALLPGLRRYARSLVKDRDRADDLVQDCLERVVGRPGLPEEGRSFKAYMYAALHNLAMDTFRRSARRGIPLALDAVEDARLALPADQEAGLIQRGVLDALDRLPEHMRAVLLLVGVEDMSYAEAAETLGIPQGTLMSRLHRARAQLRRELADDRPQFRKSDGGPRR